MDVQVNLNLDIGEKLVEKIADAVEIIYDPYGDKKAYKELVKTIFNDIGENETLSYEDKIGIAQECRFLLKKNKNRKKIISDAIGYLQENASPNLVDDSWLVNFWDKAGTVSDEMFQNLWSRILAEEVNKPNTVSKRLLHNLSLMSTYDANNFINLCRFCFFEQIYKVAHPIIFIKDDSAFYSSFDITSDVLKELEQFSLIETNYDTGFVFLNRKILTYGQTSLDMQAKRIPVGNVKLTSDGQKLFSIISKSQDSKILDYTIEKLQYTNCEIKAYFRTHVNTPYASQVASLLDKSSAQN